MSVDTVIDRVAAWIARAGAPGAGEPIVLGCSGGGDSTALLAALGALGHGPLLAVYVDHGLRDGTDEEARTVAGNARSIGASFERVAVTVSRRGNLLAAAREARYQALLETAHRRGACWVAVGHTATDQAETVLFRAARGDVVHALTGIPPCRALDGKVTVIRPLLEVRRDEAAAFAVGRGLALVHDPSNDRLDFMRIRIRKALENFDDGSLQHQLAELACATALWVEGLDEQAEALGPLDDLDSARIANASLDVALRLLRRAGLHDAGFAHARALQLLASASAGSRSIDLGKDFVAERRYGRVRLGCAGSGDPGDLAVAVDGPGRYQMLGYEVILTLTPDAATNEGPTWPWRLRNARPGDRVRTRAGHRKLSDLFTDRKIPAADRRRLPMLIAAGEVVWVAGLNAPFILGDLRGVTVQCAPSPSGNSNSLPTERRLTPPGRVQ